MCLRGSRRSKSDLNMDLNGAEISKVVGQITDRLILHFNHLFSFIPNQRVQIYILDFYQQSVNSFYGCILMVVIGFSKVFK